MGRPFRYAGTSLDLTSRSGLWDDVFIQFESGQNDPVSDAATLRLRYNLPLARLELSENGGPWTPISTGIGWNHFAWIPTGGTDVQIQAALNDANIIGVFLEPGGAFAIGANLSIPDGKFLWGGGMTPQRTSGSVATMTFAPNCGIIINRGNLSFVNIIWDSTSVTNAVQGDGAVCECVYIQASGLASPIAAFAGSFYRVYHCTILGMTGIDITGNPGPNELWTDIYDCYVRTNLATALGVQLAAGATDHIRVRGCRFDGMGYGIGGPVAASDVQIEDCEILNTTTRAIELRNGTNNFVSDIAIIVCADGLWVDTVIQAKIRRIKVDRASLVGIHFSNCDNLQASDLTITGGNGPRGLEVSTVNNSVISNVVVSDQTYVLIPSECIYLELGSGGAFSDFTAKNSAGNIGASGIVVSNWTGGSFTGLHAESCLKNGIFFENCTSISASGMDAIGCDTGIYCFGCNGCSFGSAQATSSGTTDIFVETCGDSTFGTMTAIGSAGDGFVIVTSTGCTFSALTASGNGRNGINASGNSFCSFGPSTTNSNTVDGILAGAGDNYCNWGVVSSSLNGGFGFNGSATAAPCNLDGLFTRANVGGASAFGAGWIWANLVAV